jgi:hypothetical protein
MPLSYVGTWEWAQETHGRLRRADRARLIAQGLGARLARLPGPWRSGIAAECGPLDVPTPPDSALARAAEECARELSSPGLYAHCLRTWAFAAMFAQRNRVRHDEELLYLACVLHDLGLTAAHNQRDASAACFAVEGARAAHALVQRNGASESQARVVAEAITLHLNVTVPRRLGAEAHLLSMGVSLDVVGRRMQQLPIGAMRDVSARWPRNGLGPELVRATTEQARARPRSRSALLHRLGFAELIEGNPLDGAAFAGRKA